MLGGNGKTAIIGIDLTNTVSEILFSWRANTGDADPDVQRRRRRRRYGENKLCARRIITNGAIYVNTLYGALAVNNHSIWWPCIHLCIFFFRCCYSLKIRSDGPPSRCRARPTLTPRPSYACATTGQKHSPSLSGGGDDDWSHPSRCCGGSAPQGARSRRLLLRNLPTIITHTRTRTVHNINTLAYSRARF